MKVLCVLLLALSASAESLRYAINWPSGLSLGEATLSASEVSKASPSVWSFDMDIDASLPGFALRDHDHSTANADLCSIQLDKSSTRGRRKSEEKLVFDQKAGFVSRENLNGGAKSEVSFSACGRDAFAFLQFARTELAQGRIAPQQSVLFGSTYQVRLEYTGQQSIKIGEKPMDVDRIVASIKGPASDIRVEIFFARDSVRTPVLAKIPAPLGLFSVELVR